VRVPAFSQDLRFTRSADGTRLAYAVHGDGFPFVRAAHWLTNIEQDWQTPIWRPWFDALGERYRFHRYDSRGCGLSDREATDASLDVLVADLEAVVDAAKLDQFALLGISQGGAVSIAYAARHPERVRNLVLLGAFARGPLRRNPTPDELESFHAQLKLIEVGWGKDPAFLQLFTNQLLPNATPEQVHAFNDLQRMSCSPAHAARIVSSFSAIDASCHLPEVACPTLVLHPRGDMCAPFSEGILIASSIPGARLVPLETASHVPMAGEPSFDRVIEEIEAFLPRTRDGGAAPFPSLTPRERQILVLIAQGLDNLQIAAHLERSEKTVRNTITSIFDKLGVENRGQAIVLAREAGLVQEARR
jgi:pimeloyl-ACP methyl ester carboxylesterase/DNA-binding CsgD family transcriptional regulator